jgi:hypothetical protein
VRRVRARAMGRRIASGRFGGGGDGGCEVCCCVSDARNMILATTHKSRR